MRLILLISFAWMWGCSMNPVFASGWPAQRPKLVVVIVIDQFRADYLSRFRSEFGANGFRALTDSGAYYPYGQYDILQSMTGPGHATVLTGAYPYQMGIPINDWYDQDTHAKMNCVQDATTGVSPKNLVGSTLGDEMKNINLPSKVVTVAIKDRAAVLLGGHRADLALWMSGKPQRLTTSSYYRKDLPAWAEKFNATAPDCESEKPCSADLTAQMFNAALIGEKMGQGAGPDLLAVSFSGHDSAGHKFGPNAPEMKVMTLAEDRAIASMLAEVAKRVPGGLKNVLFVLTGDHGVAPLPEDTAAIGSGRIDEVALTKQINAALVKSFGKAPKGEWLAFVLDFNFYLDEENVRLAKVDISKMEKEIKAQLLSEKAFAQVITQAEVQDNFLPPGVFARRTRNTLYPGRSGHVIALQKPFYIDVGHNRANHMTSYSYDRTVPIVISGPGIKPGVYPEKAEVVDIAPTLAFLLGILPPALSEGRVLSEALVRGK